MRHIVATKSGVVFEIDYAVNRIRALSGGTFGNQWMRFHRLSVGDFLMIQWDAPLCGDEEDGDITARVYVSGEVAYTRMS